MKKGAFIIIGCIISSYISAELLPYKENPYPTIDQFDMFSAIYHFPKQLEEGMKIGETIQIKRHHAPLQNIVFAGMGGSAIAGDIAASLCDRATVPMISNRNYTLPSWVDQHTIVILLSYSGNTEETISCMHEALNRGATVIGITTGGIIKDELLSWNCDVITVPDGMMPRAALGYLSVPLLYILHQLNQIGPEFKIHLKNLVRGLTYYRNFLSDDTSKENFAFSTAQQMISAMPIIYAESGVNEAVAKRWRTQLAENSKLLTSIHTLPELNHNEIVAWQNQKTSSHKYGIIWLVDSSMHKRNKKRLDITHTIIGNHAAYQKIIRLTGQSLIERTFYAIHIGDWISYWAAILKEVDPTPIDTIETLKRKMKIEA